MSDAFLRYIPTDPTFVPSAEAANAAEAWLRKALPKAERITAAFLHSIGFVDAGSNWAGVSCPVCGADADEWWGEAMSNAAEGGFASLVARAGCCGTEVSLNQLRYAWPVGFASFVLEAKNPSQTGLSGTQLSELHALLGCEITEIRAHV